MIDLIVSIYNFFVYQPLLNSLVVLYEFLPWQDLGLAVIIFTVLVRIVLFPLNNQAFRAQKKLQLLQPKLQELQKRLQHNKEKQASETLAFYKTEGISPFAGLLPLLIQIPLLIALYQIFFAFGAKNGLQASHLQLLYSFVHSPGNINPLFFGVVNLSTDWIASAALAVVAGILQFIQTRQVLPQKSSSGEAASPFAKTFQQQATYLFPVITVFVLFRLPAAVGLYWATTAAFSIWQQHRILKKP